MSEVWDEGHVEAMEEVQQAPSMVDIMNRWKEKLKGEDFSVVFALAWQICATRSQFVFNERCTPTAVSKQVQPILSKTWSRLRGRRTWAGKLYFT